MALMYAMQAACSNPGFAFLAVASYLSDTLGFSATQLASFQAIVFLPWFAKPLLGILTDGLPLWGYRFKSYLVICYATVVISFIGLGSWPQPSARVLLIGLVLLSTGIACSDVLADRLMVIRGRATDRINRLQAAQWTGLGFTAVAVLVLGGWSADHLSLARVFFLSALLPVVALGWILLNYSEERDFSVTLRQSWQQFLRGFRQSELSSLVWLVILLQISPMPLDYPYQREVLAFDNTLIGQLKAVEFLGIGLGALTFGLVSQKAVRLPLLRFAIMGSAIATLSLAFMQDATTAYGVYLVRGIASIVALLSLFGIIARRCPKGAEGFTYALLVSISNLAASGGLIVGGQLYDWGLSFALVAVIGAGYTLVMGGAIALYKGQKWQL